MSAFRLSKQDRFALTAHAAALRRERQSIASKFEVFEQVLRLLPEALNELIERHNVSLTDAQRFVERVASDARDEWDGRSERWQESEAGQSALAYVEAWEEARLETVKLVTVLLPDAPTFDENMDLPEEGQ